MGPKLLRQNSLFLFSPGLSVPSVEDGTTLKHSQSCKKLAIIDHRIGRRGKANMRAYTWTVRILIIRMLALHAAAGAAFESAHHDKASFLQNSTKIVSVSNGQPFVNYLMTCMIYLYI